MQCDDRAGMYDCDACEIWEAGDSGARVANVPSRAGEVNFGQVIVNNTQRCCDISAGELVRFA